jgi:hypothetical protein
VELVPSSLVFSVHPPCAPPMENPLHRCFNTSNMNALYDPDTEDGDDDRISRTCF